MKAAIIILSDPNSNSEEAQGRTFNALAAAYDFKQKQEQVQILFQGAGTRWAGVLTRTDHPFNALFNSVKDKVAGVSCGCAEAFGATEAATRNAFELVTENSVPNTTGLPSLARLAAEGYTILTF